MRDGEDHPHRLEPAALPRAGAEGGHAHRASCKAGDPGDCRDRGGVLAGSLARARQVGLEHRIAANTALAVIAPGSVPVASGFLVPAAYAAARPLVRNPTLIALATAAIVRSALRNGCAADTSPQYRHGASNHPPYRTSPVTKALGGEYDGRIISVRLKTKQIQLDIILCSIVSVG